MKAKRSIRRILLGLSFSLLIVPVFTIKLSAGLLATDSVSANHYNAVASGYLAVYDNYAYATTSYARSGSDIGVGASIDATYRYGGKNNVLNDVLLYNVHGYIKRICENLRFIISEIIEENREYIDISFIYKCIADNS